MKNFIHSCSKKINDFSAAFKTKKDICTVWQKQCKIDFNFFYNNEIKSLSFPEFIDFSVKNSIGKIVVNGGHYIPNVKHPDNMGKNPLKTWDMACTLVSALKDKGHDARISLLINDLPLSIEERKDLTLNLPLPYLKLLKEHKLAEKDVLFDSINKNKVYVEKRLSNKISYQIRRTNNLNDYKEDEIKNHCHAAVIGYLRDIKKQDIKTSIWIQPKCSTENLFHAIKLFDEAEGGLRHIVYFETDNCYL